MPKPDPKVLLGKEMRGLWTVPEGYYLMGCDGSNLEGMIAAAGAFEFDGGEYLRIMMEEDAHERNARAYTIAAGKEVTRSGGKGVTYGIMYGAQAPKIAAMLGIPLNRAQAVIDAFWDSNFGLKMRREWLEKFWEANGRRYIPGMDGRKIWTRSKHSLLNAYQQNGGASLFDLMGVLFHWELVKRGWYDQGVRRVIYYHDEIQVQVPERFKSITEHSNLEAAQSYVDMMLEKGHRFDGHYVKAGKVIVDPDVYGKYKILHCPIGELATKCVEKASKIMGLPVLITGEYLCGYTWADSH